MKLRLSIALCVLVLAFVFAPVLLAAEADLKPGDTIGPHNWEKIKGMVGENFLNRVRQGYSFQIKEARPRRAPREFLEATERYAGQASLSTGGALTNYSAGMPFPRLDGADSQAGLKLAWNFFYRWRGDDFKEGGGTASGRGDIFTIEKDGSERRTEIVRHEIKTRGRVSLEPRPTLPGYEHIEWMIIRADEYPRDTSGTTTLEIRYVDPVRDDDTYVYVPNIRRVRRVPQSHRCTLLAPSEFNFDDVNSFNGKITNFNYKFLGHARMLGSLSQREIPYPRKSGDYLPLKEGWEIVDTYVLEITPKNKDYCYPRKLLYIDTLTLNAIWVVVFDAKGALWKEQINLYAPVKITDGQEVVSPSMPNIVNVQNGRATVLSTKRAFNQGYQPTFFTLATLQQVMRGGSPR